MRLDVPRCGLSLVLAASLSLGSCTAGPPITRPSFSPIVATADTPKRQLPIIDANNHLNGDMTGGQLVQLMDDAGVRRMVLMARYYRGEGALPGSDEQAVAIARRYPGRFIPFVAGQRGELARESAWMNVGATRMLIEAESGLRSGEYFGLGEFILRHLSYLTSEGQPGGEIDIPVDTPLMLGLIDVAARYRVPVVIHAEAEPQVVPAMKRVLRHQPQASIIWAHSCGRANPKLIRELLHAHRNLYCDLGGMMRAGRAGYGEFWPRRTPWIFPVEGGSGDVFGETRELWEDFPTRLLLGTDVAHSAYLRDYGDRITRLRLWLLQLSPSTARRLAYENAEALLLSR